MLLFPFRTFALLVGFSSVQPNATDQGADHPRDDNGKADPASIHLFSLTDRRRQGIGQGPYGLIYRGKATQFQIKQTPFHTGELRCEWTVKLK